MVNRLGKNGRNGRNGINGINGKLVNRDVLNNILSDEELQALLEEAPALQKGKSVPAEEVQKTGPSSEQKSFERVEEEEKSETYYLHTDFKFVNTFTLSVVNEFVSLVSSMVSTTLDLTVTRISREEVFSKQDLLMLKGEISFVNIPKATYPIFLVFPRELFPFIVDSILSSPKLLKYPSEFVHRVIHSAVDWDIVKFFWEQLFLSLQETTSREFAKAKVSITGNENNSGEVVAYSLKHTLFRIDMNLKLYIWKFPVVLLIDYDFLDVCDLIYRGILKEKTLNWKGLLKEKVLSSSVEVEARIFYSNFTLRRLLSLRKGDVLSFSPENVSLVINGEPRFRTKLGTVENNMLAVTLAGEEEPLQTEMKEVVSNGSA